MLVFILTISIIAIPAFVSAAPCTPGEPGCVSLANPLSSGQTEVAPIIGIIIKAAMGIMGALVLLMLVWGGFQWLTSAGNPEKVKKGSQTMIWAVIGLFLVLSSYLILDAVLKALRGEL